MSTFVESLKRSYNSYHKTKGSQDMYLKLFFIFFSLALYAHSPEGEGVEVHFSEEERDYLTKKKVITMCIDPDWMPYEKIENGKHIGISADIFKIFQSQLPIPIKLVQTKSWEESLLYAQKRECDIFSLATATPQREEYMNFTTPYLIVPWMIATKQNVTYISSPKSLKNQKLGTIKGYASLEVLKKNYPYLDIVEVENIHDGLQKVKDGVLFAYIDSLAPIDQQLKKEFYGQIKVSGAFDEGFELGVGVRKDEPLLLSIFQKLVDTISESETQAILDQWIVIKYEKPVDYTLAISIASVAALILLILLYFQHKLTNLNASLESKIQIEVERSRQKDKQLILQSRLAQMGEMISMIAHQWRQPLGSIASTSTNLKIKLELEAFALDTKSSKEECSDYFIERLENIEEYVKSLTATIDDFRNFYKPNKASEVTTLQELMDKSLKIIESSLEQDNIELIYKSDRVEELEAYKGELMQVLLNILKNAQDNFKERGVQNPRITIDVQERVCSICDNGGGVSEDIMERIFEPYFSTKDEKNGTGLGLYMSKIIVEEHHKGTFKVENRDDGVCFIIELGETL